MSRCGDCYEFPCECGIEFREPKGEGGDGYSELHKEMDAYLHHQSTLVTESVIEKAIRADREKLAGLFETYRSGNSVPSWLKVSDVVYLIRTAPIGEEV